MINRIASKLNISNEMAKTILDVKKLLDSSNIKYSIVGGLSVGFYSSHRTTKDIDILVSSDDLFKLRFLFKNLQPLQMETHSGYTTKLNDIDIDFILVDNEDFLLKNSITSKDIGDSSYASLENLIYLKLTSGRVKDVNDVVQMLKPLSEQEKLNIRDKIISNIKTLNISSGEKSNKINSILEDFNSTSLIAELENKKSKQASVKFVNHITKKLKNEK